MILNFDNKAAKIKTNKTTGYSNVVMAAPKWRHLVNG